MSQRTIVITRPKGDEISLRNALQEADYRVIHEPLTEIFLRHDERIHVEMALSEDPDAVIITSRHGVHALALLTEIRDVFLLCVGEATMEAAMALGFSRVSNTGGTVDHMIEYIQNSYDGDARFLYISGEHVHTDIGEVLGGRGMTVERVVAYEAMAVTRLSDTLLEQLRRRQIDGITFLSARTVQIFQDLARKGGATDMLKYVDAFCLSGGIADTAADIPWRSIHHAYQPTLASLVKAVDNAYATS